MTKSRGTRLLTFSLLIVFVLVTLLSGCGSNPMQSAQPSEQAGGNSKSTFTIGVALASDTNPLYVGMMKGIEAKAKVLGVNIRSVIANEDQTRQVNAVQDLITSKVDAILISPISEQGALVAYESAKKAGIPIISVARSIKRPDLEASYVGMDIVQDGRNIGEWLVKKLNSKGNVAMLKGPAGASFAMDMEKGFKEVLGKYPEIKIVGEVNSEITKEQGLKNTDIFLTANPSKLDAIYSASDELALGAVQAADAAGRLKGIVITGYNGGPTAIDSIKERKLGMTIALRSQGWGQLALQTVVDILNSKSVAKQVMNTTKIVDQDNVGKIIPEEIK